MSNAFDCNELNEIIDELVFAEPRDEQLIADLCLVVSARPVRDQQSTCELIDAAVRVGRFLATRGD